MKEDQEKMKAKIQEMKQRVESLYPQNCQEILRKFSVGGRIDETISRFLVARNMKSNESFEMIKNALKWREDNDIDTITERYPIPPEKSRVIRQYYPHGFHKTDKDGNFLWIERVGFINLESLIQQVSVKDVVDDHIQIMEYKNKMLAPIEAEKLGRLPKTTVIVDMASFRLTSIRKIMLTLIQEISKVDQDYYPENLNKLYIVNAPMLFSGTWKLIEVFLSDVTKKKIKILGKKYQKDLLDQVDAENLPAFLGGNCTCQIDVPHGGCISSAENPTSPFFTTLDEHIKKATSKANSEMNQYQS